MRRLSHHILRQSSPPDPALIHLIEHDPRLRKLQGAVYYRQLIDLERPLPGSPSAQPVFPSGMDVERRMLFLSAHISLSALCARVSSEAPPIPASGCPSHAMCALAWADMWAQAAATCCLQVGSRTPPQPEGSADVLGRLRAMTPVLNRMVTEAPTMSVGCGLAALDAVGALIIDGLMGHFASP